VPGREQLPGGGTSNHSGDPGDQDPHKLTISARSASQVTFS
jgi:hypothetical protein